MVVLCNKCRNYLVDGNDTFCSQDIWPRTNLLKSKIFNALMFECIDYERANQRNIKLPPELDVPNPFS